MAVRQAEAGGPGKSMQGVGQQAKLAVAAAREAGLELPANAQGRVASAVARGIDPGSLFSARVSEPQQPGVGRETEDVPAVEAPEFEAAADATEAGAEAEETGVSTSLIQTQGVVSENLTVVPPIELEALSTAV